MINFKKEKKAQVTIFIILGIAIVAAVVAFFLFATEAGRGINPLIATEEFSSEEIVQRFEECLTENEEIENKKNDIMLQGGSIEPESNHRFMGRDIQYLCYTNNNYETCTMQFPFPLHNIRDEFQNSIEPEFNQCVEQMVSEFENSGYEVNMAGDVKYEVDFVPDRMIYYVEVPITVSKQGATTIVRNNMEFEKESGTYTLAMIASSILNYEARYGDANTGPYMLVYPNVGVEKVLRDDGTKIYTLEDRTTEEKFSFAVRSLIIPPGYSL